MHPRIRLMLVAIAVPMLGIAAAGNQPAANSAVTNQPVRLWAAAGGGVQVRWNHDLARDLGIRIAFRNPLPNAHKADGERFDLRQSGRIRFRVKDGYFRGFRGGALHASGGYVLNVPDGTIALDNFRLMPRASAAGQSGSMQLDLVGSDGIAWFYVDRLMHELADQDTVLAVRSSDLRITPQLARRLRQPAVAGWTIGQVTLDIPIQRKGSGAMALADAIRWHGDAAPNGGTYQNDLFMKNITAQYMRCDGCTGEHGSGRVVITPSSELRNNVNNGSVAATIPGDPLGTSTALWTASIPWYSKFSGNFAPYNNDQHPYLIWNMYRINADGSLEQIGRSGVKHAYLTTNVACLDANDHNAHVLGRGCTDIYTVSNNDFSNALGPRSEIIPATGQWGRCGSFFDPACVGASSGGGSDVYRERLVVDESQIAASGNPGARWLFESWYVARQDINIDNSMATLRVTPRWTGAVWALDNTGHALGAAIDRWFRGAQRGAVVAERAATPKKTAAGFGRGGNLPILQTRMMTSLRVAGGHAKVAVKVMALGNGQWRYHYAVMNADVSFAQTTGTEPDLRVLSNQGFDGFGLATAAAAEVADAVFRDGDLDTANNWQLSRTASSVKWTNGPSAPTSLGWGVLYSYSITSAAPPAKGQATLYASNVPTPRTYTVETLVPAP